MVSRFSIGPPGWSNEFVKRVPIDDVKKKKRGRKEYSCETITTWNAIYAFVVSSLGHFFFEMKIVDHTFPHVLEIFANRIVLGLSVNWFARFIDRCFLLIDRIVYWNILNITITNLMRTGKRIGVKNRPIEKSKWKTMCWIIFEYFSEIVNRCEFNEWSK